MQTTLAYQQLHSEHIRHKADLLTMIEWLWVQILACMDFSTLFRVVCRIIYTPWIYCLRISSQYSNGIQRAWIRYKWSIYFQFWLLSHEGAVSLLHSRVVNIEDMAPTVLQAFRTEVAGEKSKGWFNILGSSSSQSINGATITADNGWTSM